MKRSACVDKPSVESWILSPRLFPQHLKLASSLTQILIYHLPACHVESESAENLFEVQDRKGIDNSFGGFSPQKCVNNRVQRNASLFDEVPAVPLFDVFIDHSPVRFQYSQIDSVCGRYQAVPYRTIE